MSLLATAVRGQVEEWVTANEMESKDQWVTQRLMSPGRPVFSFRYHGESSAQLLPKWQQKTEIKNVSDGRTRRVITWTDPVTQLEVRLEAVDYSDYPAVEWTVYLKNGGTVETPILDRIRGLDSTFGKAEKKAVLRTGQGDNFSAKSYEPFSYALGQQAKIFQPGGGRPTSGAWPYFNIDFGQSGIIVALGWPAQWEAQFFCSDDAVTACGGQQTTHFKLLPGEEIRTPLVAVVFWKGRDWLQGQNLWRRWFVAHNIPRPSGKLPGPIAVLGSPGLHGSAAEAKAQLHDYLLQDVKLDYYWIDAGWYKMENDDWFTATGIGTWTPDLSRYPGGVHEISDYVHDNGMKFVLWFEPERVYRGSYLWEKHPEWLLKWPADDKEKNDLRLLNLGNPDARKWITDYISRFLTDQVIDVYRQDFNVEPLKAWDLNDAPDRQGITENFYVQGYLAYWDALLQQHPGLLIDSCASGGRRNDLESLRRSVPLLRSDFQAPTLSYDQWFTGVGGGRVYAQYVRLVPGQTRVDVFDGNQGHTYGLSLWVPFYGTGEFADDQYSARSHLCPSMGMGTHWGQNPDWPAYRKQVSDYRKIWAYFYGDFWPLTEYTLATDAWIAWEFVRPEHGDGMIQAFRRELCPTTTMQLWLRAIEMDTNYEFTDMDTGRVSNVSGKELKEHGLFVQALSPRTAIILTFKKTKSVTTP
jgi:alpha-galactosidase